MSLPGGQHAEGKNMNSFPEIEHNEQAGGNASFQFAPISYIYAIPLPVDGKVTTEINMNGDYTFLSGYSSPESLSFEEQMQQNAPGPTWQPVVKGFYPKATDDINSLLQEMSGHRFVLIVTDNNGVKRIAGNLSEPLSFRYRSATGVRPSERPGIEFEFSGICTSPSPVYTYEAPAPGS